MLAVNLDDEAEKYLIEILSRELITSQELVKELLRDRYLRLQQPQTILDRLGGISDDLLDGEADLSSREKRHQKISNYLQEKYR